MPQRMPTLFFGHGNPMNALLVTPVHRAVGGSRSWAPETQGNSFCVGALVHSGCCRDGKRFCVVFGGNPVCQLRARLGNHSARERACCTISTKTPRVSAGLLTSRKNAMRAPRMPS